MLAYYLQASPDVLQGFISMLETCDKKITVCLVVPRPWLHNHPITGKGLQMIQTKSSRCLLAPSAICSLPHSIYLLHFTGSCLQRLLHTLVLERLPAVTPNVS